MPASPAIEEPRPPAEAIPWLGILAATAAGALPRLFHLGRQVLADDELHAVRVALRASWREILTTYHVSDNCIPLTALDRLALDLGLPLGEPLLRLPGLVAGILLPAAVGWAVARLLDSRSGLIAAWLAALSPALVLYSRIARPYLPATLLVLLAIVAAGSLLSTGSGRALLAYASAGAAAAWFLLPALPALLAPLLPACANALRTAGTGRRIVLRRLLAAAGALGLAGGLLMAPALPSLVRLAGAKRVAQTVPAATWAEASRILAGTDSAPVAALFWAAVLTGIILAARRSATIGMLAAAVIVGQPIGIRLLSPLGLPNPTILARYLLPALPIALAAVAVALATLARALPRALRFLPALAPGLLVLAGPLVRAEFRQTSFLGHSDFLRFTAPLAEASVSPCYARLEELPPGPLLELPWPASWAVHVPYIAERRHARPVMLGVFEGPITNGASLRTLAPATVEGALASGAVAAVLHADPAAEERGVRRAGQPEPFFLPQAYVERTRDLAELHRDFRRRLGEPLCTDREVSVWALRP